MLEVSAPKSRIDAYVLANVFLRDVDVRVHCTIYVENLGPVFFARVERYEPGRWSESRNVCLQVVFHLKY